jgi:hypothetical protein
VAGLGVARWHRVRKVTQVSGNAIPRIGTGDVQNKKCKSLNLTWRTSHGSFKLSDSCPNSGTGVHVSFSGWPTVRTEFVNTSSVTHEERAALATIRA